jgi:cell division protein FtsA
MREILEDAYRYFLNHFQEAEYLTAGMVLTGGAALTQNVVLLCEEIFNMPVRIGYPDFSLISGPVSRLDMPANATIIGLLYYALEQEVDEDDGGRRSINMSKNINGFFKNIIKLFKDFS